MKFTFKKLAPQFAIAKFKSEDTLLKFKTPNKSSFFQFIQTDDETSVLCEEGLIDEKNMIFKKGWTGFRVEGTMDLGLTGVTATISKILNEANINILATATFDTDYFFVPTKKFEKAKKALEMAGHTFKN